MRLLSVAIGGNFLAEHENKDLECRRQAYPSYKHPIALIGVQEVKICHVWMNTKRGECSL